MTVAADPATPALSRANGARLGWLLLPDEQAVEVWPASGEPRRIAQTVIPAGPGYIH
ncbi:MAG: hypothetical protein WBN89_14660 [Prochlorococcaceae cyanobacterium]